MVASRGDDSTTRLADRVFAVGVGIWVVWGVAVIVNVILPDHEVPGTVNVVAPIVAGGMFGGGILGGVVARRRSSSGRSSRAE